MTLALTADGIALTETIRDTPPLRARQHSLTALDAAGPLFAFVSAGYSLAALLAPTAMVDPALAAARGAFATLARAHAMDIYDDAGQQAQSWPMAYVDALQTLRLLIGLSSGKRSPAHWTLQAPRFVLEVGEVSALEINVPSPVNEALPPQVRTLTMDEVAICAADVADAQVIIQATRIYPLLGADDVPSLTLATGAVLAMRILPALTGYHHLSLSDPAENWASRLSAQS